MTRSYFTLGLEVPGKIAFDHDSYEEDGGIKMNWPMFIGLLVTFIGLAMTAIGLMVQKYALNKRLKQKEEDRGSYFLEKWWMVGMTVFCLGNLLFWSVLALVPQVVLACWQCWAMIITILLAPLILGEMVTMFKLLNVLVIVAGVVWVVMASPGEYEEYSSKKFWAAVHDVTFICISSGMLALFLLLLASQWWTLSDRKAAMRFVLIAAIINWYSVLAARCSSGFLLSGVLHQNELGIGFEFWLLLGLMLTFAALNVHFLNKALECDKAIFVVPVYEALAISGQILFGIVFFREFDGLSTFETLNISFGVAVVMGGVLLSAKQEPDTPFLKQIVISEELCACCFCCASMEDIDSASQDDAEGGLCSARNRTASKDAADQPTRDPGASAEGEPAVRGYQRKNGGPRGRGDGGPRDPRGARSSASGPRGDHEGSEGSAATI